jgi:hypothetical protein
MARAFTSDQKALLRSPDLQVNALATFFLDEGTYRFCDDRSGFDLTDGVNTYIGANALADAAEIRGSSDLAAEQVTLILDGNRMTQAGVEDPARVLRDIMEYLTIQRRVDYAFGLRYSYSQTLNLIIPAFAGKISSVRWVDGELPFTGGSGGVSGGSRIASSLEIVLDSLAARYSRASNRTRSHEDQLEIDPTDNFYSFTQDIANNERMVYWGKASPFGGSSTGRPVPYMPGGPKGRPQHGEVLHD